MNKIKLGTEVVVSDPCYTIPTWCQVIVNNVLPGYYEPIVKKHEVDGWGNRVSVQMCIHEDYIGKEDELDLTWVEHGGTVGVDSGQAGIFSRESYRNDSITDRIGLGDGDISFFGNFNRLDEEGEKWYINMCSRTLGVLQHGVYDEGMVSSSGFGDGSYDLYVLTTPDEVVVGFCIDFQVEEDGIELDFYKDPQYTAQ
jgi:hypothetical protein